MGKNSMNIVMKIVSQVDKALPKDMRKIAEEVKNLNKDIKALKDMEKAYGKHNEAKKKSAETILQFRKQRTELNKLKKVKESNKKLSKSEEKIYRELSKDVNKLSKSVEKNRTIAKKYRNEMNLLPKSYEQVQKEIKETRKQLDKLNAKHKIAGKVNNAYKKIGSFGKKGLVMAGKAVATAAIAGTIALSALGASSARTYIEFNKQMKRVQAISGATKEEFNLLEKSAMSLGATTSFTSAEVAAGMEKMALAGFSTTEVLKGIPGVLDLAAASGEEVALVSDIITDNLIAFNMTAKDTGRFADVLAWGMSNTNVNVGMLGESFKYAAGSARGLGVSLEEMVGSLGLMGDQAIKSGMAGRGLDAVFSKLSGQKDLLSKIGISVENDDGSFVGIVETVKQFEEITKKMGDVEKVAFLENVFGKQGSRSFSKLLSAEKVINGITYKGAKAVEQTINAASKDSVDSAKKMKDIMLEGASGTWVLLTSAFDGLKIALGKNMLTEGVLETVKQLTNYVSGLANVINGVFDDSSANVFWQNIFKMTKNFTGKILKILEPVISSLTEMFSNEKINKSLELTITSIGNAFLVVIEIFTTVYKVVEPVIKFILENMWMIFKTVEMILKFISFLLTNLIKNIKLFVMGIWELIKGIFTGIHELFKFGGDLIVSLVEWILDLPNIIANVFIRVIETIKEKMMALKELIKLPKPPEWVVNLVGKIKGSPEVDGSHYNGLTNVPYDGYIAELHRGERVLTATENEGYSKGIGAKVNRVKTNTQTSNILNKNKEIKNEFIFSPTIQLTINGDGNIEDKVRQAVEKAVKEAMRMFKNEMGDSYEPRTAF